MASFTGVGDNTTLTLTNKGEAVTVAISGTYNMTIALQREQGSPSSGAWGDIKRYTTANATVSETYTTVEDGERVRLIVLVDTSGTATATLTNATDEVFSSLTIKDPLGTVKAQFDQGGLLLPEDLDVTGNTALTGTLAVTGASTLTGLTTHAEDVTFSNANPEIRGGDADGALFVGPSTTNALGGNAVFYGDTHATKAGDIEFRNTSTLKLNYDLSATKWVFADDVHFSVANPELLGADNDGALLIGPDTTSALGGNVILYGAAHSTKAGDIELRNTATVKLGYDLSATKWVFADDVHFSVANPELLGADNDGALFVGPDTTNALGGNIVLYGAAHATQAGDIEFRNTATPTLSYDLSATKWVFADDVHFSVANPELLGADTDGALFIGPSTTNALGGNVVFYGDTHATKANDIELRATATAEAHYDDSASTWDFQANALTTTGSIVGIPNAELQSVDPSQKFVLFDDFYGTWLITDAGPADMWSATGGAGAGTEVATTVAASINGEITMKSSTADGTTAQNNTTITGINLGFKANQGGLAIETRLKIDDITEAYLFVGFTDVISTTVESPLLFTDGTDDLIAEAGDACGIVFTGDSTTQQFALGGVAATTVTAETFSGSAPANGTYVTLRVEVSAAGAVTGYVDGTLIGTIASAITATTAITPCVVVGNTAAAQTVMTIDYIWVQQNR